MSAQFSRFGFFAVTGGEGMDFAAPFVGKLEGHMSQTTDANDTYPGSGGRVVNQQGRKYGDAAAKERPHFCHVQRIRQRSNPRPLGSNTIGETSMASDNSSLSSGAKMLLAGKAFVACQTAMSVPAEPDTLPNLKSFRPFTKCDNCSCHLMSRHKRVLGHAPFVVEHREIRVTKATM